MAKVHAVLSASGASRWLACPASIRLSEGKIASSSPAADEGTAAHQVAELCLKAGINTDKFTGDFVTVRGKQYEVTDEMKEAVQLYLDTVRADVRDPRHLRIEVKFKLDHLYPDLFGTSDAVNDEPFGTLRVYDFKYGAGIPVEVTDNAQLKYYALGALEKNYDMYDSVEIVVVQPRAYHADGPVRRRVIPIDGLVEWANKTLVPGARRTKDPDAPIVAGEHCRFCPALADCPAHHERALTLAKEAFAEVPAAPPAPESLPLIKLKTVLDASVMVESWIEACRNYARALLESGQAMTEDLGYKLVEGRASRSWNDEKEAAEFLQVLLGEEAYITKLLSPSQAEKMLKGPSKKALEGLVKITRGTQLAPASDKRAAVTPAIAAFEVVEI